MRGSRSRTGRDGRAISTAILSLGLLVSCAAAVAAQEPERLTDGVALKLGARRLELRACRDDVVRVIDAAPGAFFGRQSLDDRGGRLPADDVRGEAAARRLRAHDEAPRRPRRDARRPALVPRPRGTHPDRREGGRRPQPRAGRGDGRGDRARAGRVRALPGRGLLRPRRAPERPDELRRPRRRHVPAQHGRHRAVPGLEPRLRAAVGQHVAHEVRRSRASPCTSRRRTSTTPRASPGGLTGTYRQGDCASGTRRRDARRSADRLRRAGGSAGDLGDPQRAPGRELRAASRSSRTARPASCGTARSSSRSPATTTS